MSVKLDRRELFFWVFGSLFLPSAARAAASRVIALDWAIVETLIALGLPPTGAGEVPNYNRIVVEPRVPASVVDVGLRLAPNLEVMALLRPDLILLNPAQDAFLHASLAAFGSVQVVPIYTNERKPYALASAAATDLARQLGDPAAGEALLARAAATMQATRNALRNYDGRPLLVVEFVTGKDVVVHGPSSLVQGVLDQLGLQNAWRSSTPIWGVARVDLEDLGAWPEARLVYYAPVPPEARRTLATSLLWRNLPFVRAGRVVALPPLWGYGGLPSALRIARLLGEYLIVAEPPRG